MKLDDYLYEIRNLIQKILTFNLIETSGEHRYDRLGTLEKPGNIAS